MKLISLLISLFFISTIQAQITLQLQPNPTTGKDAYLASGAGTKNYGQHPDLAASASTCNGIPCNARGIFQFDLSSIPSGSTIISAKLSLYANVPYNNSGVAMSGTNNSSVIQRVLSAWDANLVTWDTQPSTTPLNQVFLATSKTASQNYTDIDVTSLVTDMVPNNFGFLLKLQNEQYYNFMQFASSNYPDSTLRPKLVVVYSSKSCIELQPGADGKDAYLASGAGTYNYGHHPDLAASAGTCSGVPCNARGLIQFDLSKIPNNASILNASLSLYAGVSYNNHGVAMSGSNNASYLQRVTGPWDENAVTWDTQPTTTTLNQVVLASSVSSAQNYTDINVTQLVKDMQFSNNGFMLRLQNETYYNFMQFSSGDYPDSTFHPKLNVCWKTIVNPISGIPVLTKDKIKSTFSINPNPISETGIISFQLENSLVVQINIYTVQGQKVKTLLNGIQAAGKQEIEIRPSDLGLSDGIYILNYNAGNENQNVLITLKN
jgi:hypothetical protein